MEQSLSHFCGPEQNAPALFIIRPNGWPEKRSGKMKLISWNVNGLRACMGKGFLDFFSIKPMRTCSAFRRQNAARPAGTGAGRLSSILVQRAKRKGIPVRRCFVKKSRYLWHMNCRSRLTLEREESSRRSLSAFIW